MMHFFGPGVAKLTLSPKEESSEGEHREEHLIEAPSPGLRDSRSKIQICSLSMDSFYMCCDVCFLFMGIAA